MTSLLILSPCPVCVLLLRHGKTGEANQGALHIWQWKDQRAWQAQPSCCPEQEEPTHDSIAASKYFASINQVVFSTSSTYHPTNSWACLVELHINQYKLKRPEAMASHHYHLFFFFWDGNVLSRAYQTPYRGSLTAFVWKEDEEGKEKCGESSDLKWQSLDWRSNPTETITVLKNHRSWIKTFFPSSKVAINQPSHSVIPSILTEQPIDQESLLSKNIWAPLCGETFQAYGGGFQYFFEDQEN